ncbi:MAG: bifunctional nuclease family protein [Bacteroidetes bacterium]|nr:bifunctional nuclease family protein [Bacteroidota bacterium]MCL1968964.1 bifunctional nuclease family protein [Bacteroidota bacterium]
MEYIELEVIDVESTQTPSEAFALIVREKEGEKEMTIVIGLQEARTLVLLINKIQTRRPGTHELFKNFMEHSDYKLSNVTIYHYGEGVFYAHLLLQNDTVTFELDARTSDAIAIALLMEAPIFIRKDIFEKLAVLPRKEETKLEDFNPEIDLQPEELELYIENKLQEMPLKELEHLLQGAIDSEDFELASKIHDEINGRKA